MRIRVVIVVVAIAAAAHALLFVALGHIAKGKGPLIPVVASKPESPKPVPPVAAPIAPPAAQRAAVTGAPIRGIRPPQSRTLRRPRRSRSDSSNPTKQSAAQAPLPVFDVKADSAGTAAPNSSNN